MPRLRPDLVKRVTIDGNKMTIAQAIAKYRSTALSHHTIKSRLSTCTECAAAWLTRPAHSGLYIPPKLDGETKMCVIDGERMSFCEAKNRFAKKVSRLTIANRLRYRSECTSEWLTRTNRLNRAMHDGAPVPLGVRDRGVWLNGKRTTLVRAASQISDASKKGALTLEQFGDFISHETHNSAMRITGNFIAVVHQADAGTVLELLT